METFTGMPYARSLLQTHIIILVNLSAERLSSRRVSHIIRISVDVVLAIPFILFFVFKKKSGPISLFRNLKMDFSSTSGSNFSFLLFVLNLPKCNKIRFDCGSEMKASNQKRSDK